MKHYLLTGLTLILLTACGGDGKKKSATLPPPSDPIYDYRNYAPATPTRATLDGFWLLVQRSMQSYRSIDLSFEGVNVISFNTLNDKSVQITHPSFTSQYLPPHIAHPVLVSIDTMSDNVIEWKNPTFTYQLRFNNTSIMSGNIKELGMDLLEHEPNPFSEVFAIKLADFPTGIAPDKNGIIVENILPFGFVDINEVLGSSLVGSARYVNISTKTNTQGPIENRIQSKSVKHVIYVLKDNEYKAIDISVISEISKNESSNSDSTCDYMFAIHYPNINSYSHGSYAYSFDCITGQDLDGQDFYIYKNTIDSPLHIKVDLDVELVSKKRWQGNIELDLTPYVNWKN